MTPSYVIRPVSDWTNFTGKPKRSNFDTPWPATEALLIREVRHLRGKDLVIEVDVVESDIRLDGRIRAAARPSQPGIRVAFDSMHGPLTYSTDAFTTWQDNVRAVALGLEALRKVDRYGITKRGEQYAGWKALPAGRSMPPSHMTRDMAYDLLYQTVEVGPDDDRVWSDKDLARAARRNSHPDFGYPREQWDRVEEALRVLGLV